MFGAPGTCDGPLAMAAPPTPPLSAEKWHSKRMPLCSAGEEFGGPGHAADSQSAEDGCRGQGGMLSNLPQNTMEVADCRTSDALEGEGPQRRPQQRLGRQLGRNSECTTPEAVYLGTAPLNIEAASGQMEATTPK